MIQCIQRIPLMLEIKGAQHYKTHGIKMYRSVTIINTVHVQNSKHIIWTSQAHHKALETFSEATVSS